jgi:uroporphyrinogen III methyltransferase/synthase
LTVKGAQLLQTADVVVYDYLASPRLLDLCRKDAEIVYVGKKGGDHTLPQDDINTLLVQKARSGAGVIVRLKGGDPYVFGRGAEEAEELVAAGIDFEVVPGVTSATAGPAYAGIPLTHRRYASSVTFITGHEDPTKPGSVHDWEALARSGSTLVFFMGVRNLPDITANLAKAGLDPATPAALVHWGTTCRQRSFVSSLEKIAEEARALAYTPPSLLVVGQVCSLKSTLDWFEDRPLLGKGVVVTRAREQASGLVAVLDELGACVWEFPTIAIHPASDYTLAEKAILRLADYDWLVFTSVNGVYHFRDQLTGMGLDSRALAGARVAAIGPATADALRDMGINPDFVPPRYVAESVVQGMLEMGVKDAKVLIPRAAKAREVLPEKLAEAGAVVEVVPMYETRLGENDPEPVLAAIKAGEVDYITFTSSSTVENFFELIPAAEIAGRRDNLKLAAIGPITAKTLEAAGAGLKADIMPRDYTIDDLVLALVADAAKSTGAGL